MEPPVCNTGVYPLRAPPPLSAFDRDEWLLGVWHWDWTRATIAAHHDLVIRAICEAAGEPLERVPGKGHHGYDSRVDLMRAGERVATVNYGGRNGHPNAEASGDHADWFRAVLDCLAADWLPTRLDPCIDFVQKGLYDKLRLIGLQVADEFRTPDGRPITFREIVNPLDPFAGRTFYLGTRSGEWFLRVYEKGLEGWKRPPGGGSPPDAVRDLVRIEGEIKPKKPDARRRAALAAPAELFGVSGVLRVFAERALSMNVEPIRLRERRQSNRDRALRAMGYQYQRHLGDLLRDLGGDLEAFGREIARLAALEAVERDMTG